MFEWVHKFHKCVWGVAHVPLSWFGFYAEGREEEDSYFFSLRLSLNEVERLLWVNGFVRNPTSFLTYRKVERGSEVERDYTKGSWVKYLDEPWDDYQVHITLYSAFDDGFVDVYGHYELSWLRHPIKHLKTVDYSVEKGKSYFEENVVSGFVSDKVVVRDFEERVDTDG